MSVFNDWTKRDCVNKYEMSPDGGPALCWDTCHVGECKNCGWNPHVEAARKRQLREQAANGEPLHANANVTKRKEKLYA